MSAEASCCKRRVALTQRKQICTMINQELDHQLITLHASYMERSVPKVSCFVYVSTSVNESFRCGKIAPSDNTVKGIIAINTTRVHIRKIGFGEVGCFMQLRKYCLQLSVHNRFVSFVVPQSRL